MQQKGVVRAACAPMLAHTPRHADVRQGDREERVAGLGLGVRSTPHADTASGATVQSTRTYVAEVAS
jgi:hypothetical protein